MKIKDKLLSKLTIKNVNQILGITIFVLVFLFTFLFSFEFKQQWPILLAVFGPLVLLIAIIWIVLVVWIKKTTKSKDINQQKIDKALEKLEQEAREESKKLDESESNN